MPNIRYEWDIETVAVGEHEDVLEHAHAASLSEYDMEQLIHAINQDIEPGGTFTRLVLVRDKGDDIEGLTDRAWAYITDEGTLPECFNNGIKVPKRFAEEFNR